MRICFVGATHPCHNPRLVREADTLARDGHDVRVVAPCSADWLAAKDRRLHETRQWCLQAVDLRGRWRSFRVRARRRAALFAFGLRPSPGTAETAYTPALADLRRQAAAEPADWFIAHAQAALPVAAWAARRQGARLGFDCEDLLAEGDTDPRAVVKAIEQEYLRECAYVSVPSLLMGARLQAIYGIAPPIVLYNVFPASLAQDMTPPSRRPDRAALRLHWFSQTIGPGRGIEDAVRALAFLPEHVEFHLRGFLSADYRSTLAALAAESRAGSRIFFHPQVDHDQLIGAMEEYDVGLALERPENPNYSLTVTNKVFSYLLAGLPVLASDTPGQFEALAQVGVAGVTYPAGNPEAMAAALRPWLADRTVLRSVQQAAWDAARRTFCWEQMSGRLLDVLSERGAPPAPVSRGKALCPQS
jgi:glycosyltransferase involved in cell wall biosynthesis